MVDHDCYILYGAPNDGCCPLCTLQRGSQCRSVSLPFVRDSTKHCSPASPVIRYRLEAGWQDALGMAALGLASASLGLQVRSRIDSYFRRLQSADLALVL